MLAVRVKVSTALVPRPFLRKSTNNLPRRAATDDDCPDRFGETFGDPAAGAVCGVVRHTRSKWNHHVNALTAREVRPGVALAPRQMSQPIRIEDIGTIMTAGAVRESVKSKPSGFAIDAPDASFWGVPSCAESMCVLISHRERMARSL
jgi:hypothetical protein